jgi:hypothetical protein
MAVEITEAGIYDLDETDYHGDPVPGGSLSASGAKKLLPPSCPAKFRYWADHGQKTKAAFELGHAAHALVLGVGAPIVEIKEDSWRRKAAQEAANEARAAGATPLLTEDVERVQAMAAAIRAHPLASALFDPDRGGAAEQSLFVPDPVTGVMRRGRLDWLPPLVDGQRLVVPDYKTAASAEPGAIAKTLENFGYKIQAPWYLDLLADLGLAGDIPPAWVFVFQEKDPPFVVTVAEPDAEALAWGRAAARRALDLYRRCTDAGRWPGYSDEVVTVGLPTWAVRQLEAAYMRGDYDPEGIPA